VPRLRQPWPPVALLFALFATRLLFVAILLPPWQNPDEPVHFAVIRTLAGRPMSELANRRDVGVQAEILQSMASHGWWKAYSEPVPDPVPREFLDRTRHMGDASDAPPLYYAAMGAYCRALGVHSVLGQYYAVRVLSLLTTLATLWIIVRAAREWFDERLALVTGTLVALVPQFALIGVSVSPDPFVFLVGALVWWQAARIANGKGLVVPVVLMTAAAAAAVLSKKLAIPLFLEIPLLAGAALLTTRRRVILAGSLFVAVAAAAATGLLRVAWSFVPHAALIAERYGSQLGWGGDRFPFSYFLVFTWRLFESAYLVAGWLRFHAPWWVIAAALAIFLASFSRGLASGVSASWRGRLAVGAAAIAVAVQCLAIYGTMYYRPDWGAQGRFLFPAIGPFAAICALGLAGWTPSSRTRWACSAALGLLGCLDMLSWLTAAVPVYARWL
jgi:hypothetical protein